jgi:hypothetical protein
MSTLEAVFKSVALRTGYPLPEVVLTINNKRVYSSTVIDTLTIWKGAEVGESLLVLAMLDVLLHLLNAYRFTMF